MGRILSLVGTLRGRIKVETWWRITKGVSLLWLVEPGGLGSCIVKEQGGRKVVGESIRG